MIRIDKPAAAPKVLSSGRGKKATDALLLLETGKRPVSALLKFDSKIYGHASVKQALKKAQNSKCCFCEAQVDHVAHGDVEHFRPKGGFAQTDDDVLAQPGYYWLAYDWTNLYFSCQICNQRNKKNLFPLANPKKRARRSIDALKSERPVFIDPGSEDPTAHIRFEREVAVAAKGSARGLATITALALNRAELLENRGAYFRPYWDLAQMLILARQSKDALAALGELVGQARHDLRLAASRKSQYSSMIASLLTATGNSDLIPG